MITLKKTLQQLTLAVAVSAVAGVAVAATNPAGPTPGASQGDFDVTLNVGDDIIINNFADLTLPEFLDGTDLVAAQNLCVGRQGANGGNSLGYNITATNAGTAFQLTDGANNIPYGVYFADSVESVQNITAGTELANSVTELNSFGTVTDSTGCTSGVTNSTVWVKAEAADVSGKPAGTYTDTVTLTVAVN